MWYISDILQYGVSEDIMVFSYAYCQEILITDSDTGRTFKASGKDSKDYWFKERNDVFGAVKSGPFDELVLVKHTKHELELYKYIQSVDNQNVFSDDSNILLRPAVFEYDRVIDLIKDGYWVGNQVIIDSPRYAHTILVTVNDCKKFKSLYTKLQVMG